jgi:hypothetical protein
MDTPDGRTLSVPHSGELGPETQVASVKAGQYSKPFVTPAMRGFFADPHLRYITA